MKKIILLSLISIIIISGCVSDWRENVIEEKPNITNYKAFDCTNSGGTVTTAMCCKSSGDFPNTCMIGACGCSPENSHEVSFCECGEGKCFTGSHCASVS